MSSRKRTPKQPRQSGGGGSRENTPSSKGKKGAEVAVPIATPTNKATAPVSSKTKSSNAAAAELDDLPSAAYLISCDVPTKQFIKYLDELKSVDKKFIIQDLDSRHLLVKLSCRHEIEKKVEGWLNENVFSAIEKIGEDFDVS